MLPLGGEAAPHLGGHGASALHRVIDGSGREHCPISFLHDVDYDVMVETLPVCITPDRLQRSEPAGAVPAG